MSNTYTADPGTAGSTTLLLQIALPCILFSSTSSKANLILRGGTNAAQAPQIDYTEHVFLPFLRRHFGLQPQITIHKRGYYPKGGGEVQFSLLTIQGPLPAVDLTERGPIKSVSGKAYVAGLPRSLAEQMRTAAITELVLSGIDSSCINISAVREKKEDVIGSGSGIVIWAETEDGCVLGGSALGRKNKDFAEVGREAAAELVQNLAHGGCVDEYLQVHETEAILEV